MRGQRGEPLPAPEPETRRGGTRFGYRSGWDMKEHDWGASGPGAARRGSPATRGGRSQWGCWRRLSWSALGIRS